MIKKLGASVILVLLLISFSQALSIITSKDSFSKGGTFFATLKGNILEPITKEDIGFFKAHVLTPVDYGVANINNTYYIWAVLPYNEGNMSLRIKDVYFKEGNEIKTQDIEKSFVITNNTAVFYAKPGLFIGSKNFILTLHNNLDNDITASYSLESVSGSTFVPAQDDKEITISTSQISETTITKLVLSSGSESYGLPMYIIKNATSEKENNTEINITENESVKISRISFDIKSIGENLKKGELYVYTIALSNKGDNSTGEINITISDDIKKYISISNKSIGDLNPKNNTLIKLNILFDKIGNFTGTINATSESSNDSIILEFRIGENATNQTSIPISSRKSCTELGGKVCLSDESCDGENKVSSGGWCCVGTCKTSSTETPSRNWTVVIVIVALVALVGVIVFLKMKKPSTARDIINKRSGINSTPI
ncbi:hypothetical protein J4463_03860 [Candidatus Pacearchaeota archaeon]|nr:hypothetical protein [Candidatus Pacearchaeota archaeon]